MGSRGAGDLNHRALRGRKHWGGRRQSREGRRIPSRQRRKEGEGRSLRPESRWGWGPRASGQATGRGGSRPLPSRARTHSSPCRRLHSVMGRTGALGGSAPGPEGRKHRLSFSSKLQASARKPSPPPPGLASASGLALRFSWSWRLRAGSWNS